jgi:hypothetical protein
MAEVGGRDELVGVNREHKSGEVPVLFLWLALSFIRG